MSVIRIPCRWYTFTNTHAMNETCEESCVIHNPSGHHMQWWPLHWRSDRGIFERICKHGVGHPDPDQGPHWAATGQDWQWVHGCCGCCKERE